MKKIVIAALVLVVVAGLLAFLSPWGEPREPVAKAQEASQGGALRVISTLFPGYDFARALLGEQGDVRLLLPPGAESHTYEPSPQDIVAIGKADLFLYVGGESEHWVKEMLSSLGEDAPLSFAMMDQVQLLEEEYTASMEQDHEGHSHGDHDHEDANHHHDHEDHDTPILDEHVWTSPKNAMGIVRGLSRTLQGLVEGEEKQKAIVDREGAYLAELAQLDAAFETVIAQGAHRKLIFGDRFPFRYFAHAYHLSYDAAFPGCSEDSEPSARTLASLIGEVKAGQIPVVFYIEFSNQKTVQVLAEETGAKPLLLHSCHNVSQQEMDGGATYLSLMQANVAALGEALAP